MKNLILIFGIIVLFLSCGDKQRTRATSTDIINLGEYKSSEQPEFKHIQPNQEDVENLSKVENFLPNGYSRNGDIDYTEVVQKVLDEHRNVEFPDFPILVTDKGLNIKSNSKLIFQENSLIKLKSSDKIWYAILNIENVENVSIYSPRIEGDRYRRLNPESEEGNWGMGLVIKSSKDINIYNPTITKCWGDGIYLGRGNVSVPNEDVLIYQALLDDNRRNGMSIICGRNLSIIEPVVSNTRGKPPESGIDVEPNGPEDIIENLTIKNPYTFNNGNIGIVLSLSQLVSSKRQQVDITILNHIDEFSEHGFMIASFRSEKKPTDVRLDGSIVVKNPKWKFNKYPYTIGITRNLCPPIEIIGAEVFSDENNPDLINEKAQLNMKSDHNVVIFRSKK